MKNGAEQILNERLEQLKKHKKSVEHDLEYNAFYQLAYVARVLATPSITKKQFTGRVTGWDMKIFQYMCQKPYLERLVIAGALLAAEIDRLQLQNTLIKEMAIKEHIENAKKEDSNK